MKIYFLVFFSIASLFLFSQNKENSKSTSIILDNDLSSINLELLSVSYSPSALIKSKLALGIELQGGMGLKISLNSPSYKYTDNLSTDWAYNNINNLIEIIKIEPFISYILSNTTYMNLGIFGSINKIEYKHPSKIDMCLGVEYSVFYGFKKIMIGHRFQFGSLFIRYSNYTDANSNVFVILFTPIVLKIKL